MTFQHPDPLEKLFYTSVDLLWLKQLICSFKYYHFIIMEDNSKTQIVNNKQYDSIQSKNGNYVYDDNFYGVNKRLYKKPEKSDDVQIKL